jgi:hypothetical protein
VTGPSLSPAQIRNRLTLAARWILRDHRPDPDGRCPVCRIPDCPAATAARDYLAASGSSDPRDSGTEGRQ